MVKWWRVKGMSSTALKAQVGQIGQNTKKWRSDIDIIYNEPVDMMKRDEVNIVWGIVVTTESYMIITNMFKTINLEKQ